MNSSSISDSFEGWETYPQQLYDTASYCFDHDLESYHLRLSKDSKRLFLLDNETFIQVTELGSASRLLRSSEEVEEYLKDSASFRGTRIFQIAQQSSVGHLAISETSMRKLLSSVEAFPPFLDVVHSFGQKFDHDAASFPSHNMQIQDNGATYESCYLMKHAEENGRTDGSESRSIRQTGMYLRIDEARSLKTVILINSPRRFQQRLLVAAKKPETTMSQIQTLFLSSVTCHWQSYVDHLERCFNMTHIKAVVLFDVSGTAEFDINAADLSSIYHLRHKACLSVSAMEASLEAIINAERPWLQTPNSPQGAGNVTKPFSFPSTESFRLDLSAASKRIKNLISRLDGASNLIQTVLDFRAAAAVQNMSEKSNDIARLAREDNERMLDISRKAARDGRTLKSITILTLVYLPASFAASVLEMGYIHVTNSSRVGMKFDDGIYVFIVLTAVFLLVTFGAWALSEKRHSKDALSLSASEPKSIV